MAEAVFQVSWGRIQLWASSAMSNNGQTVVTHELATGDVHPRSNRGLAPRSTRLDLLFDDFPGEERSGFERLQEVIAQIERGEDQIFVHPVRGAYLVTVGEFDYTVDEDSNVTSCTIEFLANDPITPVTPAGPGTSATAGQDAVNARADEINALLEPSGITSSIADDAKAAQQSWSDATDAGDPPPIRQILADVADLSASLGALIDAEGLETDLALWPVFVAVVLLGDAFRASAIAATSETANTFVMRILVPISPLALVVRVYGGADAQDRERQFRYLNDLRTQGGMLRPGDFVVMPAASSRI